MVKKVAISLGALLFVAGCSDDAEPVAQDQTENTAQTTETEESDSVAKSVSETPLEALTELASLASVSPQEASPGTLQVAFVGASDQCYGFLVDVSESETEVAVGVSTGLLPGASADDCDDEVFDYTIAVELDEPVGERILLAADPQAAPEDA